MSGEDVNDAPPRPRPRHLMDPNNPAPPPRYSISLTRVQRWVGAILAVSTIFHLAIGLDLAAWLIGGERPGSAVGLLVIAAVVGIVAMLAGRAIHQTRLLSWWLLCGLVPAIVGAVVFFTRVR